MRSSRNQILEALHLIYGDFLDHFYYIYLPFSYTLFYPTSDSGHIITITIQTYVLHSTAAN